MAHVRKQIRDALVQLLTGLPTTGNRVFSGQYTAMAADELPALHVHVDDEAIEASTIHDPIQLARACSIRVDCVARSLTTLEDDLDQMALEVEHAIAADVMLGGLLYSPMVPAAVEVERDAKGELPVGRLSLRYEVGCEVEHNAVDVPL